MLSTRVSLQWPPQEPEELSHTLVITSPRGHFVDLRILKTQNPFLPPGNNIIPPPIEDVFQWAMAGTEKPIEGTSKIEFVCEIDSQPIAEAVRSGEPLKKGPPDIGDFGPIEGSTDRKEIGRMVNRATGKVEDYVEIWRSLDPDLHSPKHEIIEDPTSEGNPCIVLEIQPGHQPFIGKFVRLGRWLQGLIHDTETNKLHAIRAHYNGTSWDSLIRYGNASWFPLDAEGQEGASFIVGPGIVWKCVES